MGYQDNTKLAGPPIQTRITADSSDDFGVPFQNRGVPTGNLHTSWSQWFSGVWNRLVVLLDAVLGFASLTNVNRLTKVTAAGTIGESSVSDDGSKVSFIERVTIDTGASPTESQVKLAANALGALQLLMFAADNNQILFDENWTGSALVARDTSVARIRKNGAKLTILGATGQTVGNPATDNTIMVIDLSNSRVGLGSNPNYALDTTGDTNTTGVYRVGGTAGLSVTITTAKVTSGGASGSMTFTGGILTAQTQAT